MTKYPPINYSDYLQLDKVLNAQDLRSEEYNKKAHDEHLFIIIHQTYELWFKQILFEVDSVLELFGHDHFDESHMGIVISRLNRIIEIERVLVDQINILETMTPLDFLDFRDFLVPASGFQSLQFRLLENKLGLVPEKRLTYTESYYSEALREDEKKHVHEAEKAPSLFERVEAWLARTPFLKSPDFDFWGVYKDAVIKMFQDEEELIRNNTSLTEKDIENNIEQLAKSREIFDGLLDKDKYQELQDKGQFRLSYDALHGALFILLYRDEPALQQAFSFITCLQNIDELLTQWRYRHSLMALRMLGSKVGTGGSSGHKYLRAATEKHKVFHDFFNLTTYLLPRSALPQLPENFKRELNFTFTHKK